MNQEFNFFEFLRIVIEKKKIFLLTFVFLLLLGLLGVFNVSKTYKSVLIAEMPLKKGIETEYIINELIGYKGKRLGTILNINSKNIDLIKKMEISNLRHENDETYIAIDFFCTSPDTLELAKQTFLSYLNDNKYLQSIRDDEIRASKEIIKVANEQYSTIVEFQKYKDRNTDIFVNPLSIVKEKLLAENTAENANVLNEVSYVVLEDKTSPNYLMLVVIVTFIAIFGALFLVLVSHSINYLKSSQFERN